ncbi:fibrinogen-binding protein, partial [Staphylococcus aureus]|uniref:fibrinogen-binding protein n=1 Tax=Staphylococcus aureus TaxID=1280 RepID=UPI001F01268E
AVNLFKRTRTVATHRKAQRAVNLIHFQHSYEKKYYKSNYCIYSHRYKSSNSI